RRAAALTHRLLAFSRQQPLDPEPLDIGRLVAGMTEMLRRTLREDIAIETRSASGLWQARVDAAQFENAVVHLALNASDAMPGGGTLRIHADNVTLDNAQRASHANVPAGDYVRMTITDTGRGMAPETVTKAFEPFFTTKPRGEGSGLGLSTVHGFISQSGGHVEIASAAGRGTTITLLLPRHISQAAPSRTACSGKPASPGHETILVVEDDEAVRRVAVGMLREVGYDVLEAPDAMEAFRLIADRGGIDLLFTDVGLPGGVNGRALADAARNVSTTMKVLFTTGYAGRAYSGDDSQTGDVHFLAKPFDFRQLVSKVRAVLDDAPELCEPAVLAEQERA
ncbi:MAG TPA: ATP-binding protein, partial [Acetobacteraceae bacterium]